MLLLAALGLCRCARRLWRTGGEPLGGALILDTAMGLGVLSLLIFACGALELMTPRFRWLWAACLVLAALWGTMGAAREVLRRRHWQDARGFCLGSPAALLLGILGISALIAALVPPSMSDWDSLAYHLAVPKLYLQHGGIYYIHFTSHSNFPMLMEMLYLAALAVSGPVAAKLMHFWTGVLLVLSVMLTARRHFGARSAGLAAVAIAGIPVVLWEATTAYIDLATALYTVLAVKLFWIT